MSSSEKDTLPSTNKEPKVPRCQGSHRDGECIWADCPQLKNYQSYCPYAKAWETYWEAEGYDY